MKISGAIFDMDGTLLDSMYMWDNAGSNYLKEKHLLPTERFTRAVRSMDIARAAELIRAEYHLSDSTEHIAGEINRQIASFYQTQVQVKSKIPALLRQLKDAGVPMCVATATDRPLAEAALRHAELLEYFDFIITSAEAGVGKDHPEIFEQALARLGTRRETTYVLDDAPFALKTAKQAGFPTVGIYDPSFSDLEAERRRFSDYYVLEPAELIGRFEPLPLCRVITYRLPDRYKQSRSFKVMVDGREIPVRDYMSGTYDDYDYAHLSFAGSAMVEIRVGEPVMEFEISPHRKQVRGTCEGTSLFFELSDIGYYIVRINRLKKLVLLVDPPEGQVPPPAGEGIFLPETYGADPSGRTSSTAALQKALDEASRFGTPEKPGTVRLTGTYAVGTLLLKSNTVLYLAGGALLCASENPQEFPHRARKNSLNMPVSALLVTENGKGPGNQSELIHSSHISVCGRGTIDINGRQMEKKGILLQSLLPVNCSHFHLDGIMICDTTIWSVMPAFSKQLTFTHMKLLNAIGTHENDGIDLNCCQDSTVSHSIAVALDDPFSVKSYRGGTDLMKYIEDEGFGAERNLFEDCLAWTICYGFKTGQGAFYDQKQIAFRNSVVHNCSVGIGVNHKYGGGSMEDITFEDIDIEHITWTNGPLQNWMDIECVSGSSVSGRHPVDRVKISRIKLEEMGKAGSFITGYENSPSQTNGIAIEDQVGEVIIEKITLPDGRAAHTLEALRIDPVQRCRCLLIDGKRIPTDCE